MAIALALCACVAYGLSAVVGGLVTRETDAKVVFLFAQATSLVFLVPLLLAAGGSIHAHDIWLGLVAGTLATLGTVTNLRALALGRMAVVGALIGLMMGFVPVVAGVIFKNEHLNAIAVEAVAIGLCSIVLVAAPDEQRRDKKPKWTSVPNYLALFGGACVGTELVVLSYASSTTGFALLFVQRLTNAALLGPLVAVQARSVNWKLISWPLLVLLGALYLTGDITYTAASHRGDLYVAGIIVSLSPVVIAVIARTFLKQKLSTRQATGIGVALTSIILFSAR